MDRSEDWLDEARGDLRLAAHAHEGGFHNWACFAAQQGAEKAVKAVFQDMGAEAWGHSVTDLLRELARTREVPEGLLDAALELDKAYIPTRYPNAHQSGSARDRYTSAEAERLRGHAGRVFEFCEGLLSRA